MVRHAYARHEHLAVSPPYGDVDHAFVPDISNIHAAATAGLGEIGYSGLLLTPEFGPRQRFCTLISNVPLAGRRPCRRGAWGRVMAGVRASTALGYWDTRISWSAAATAFGFSVSAGILFGLYPTLRAARLEPIAARRSK